MMLIDKAGEFMQRVKLQISEINFTKEAKDDVTTINNATGFLQSERGFIAVDHW